MLTSAQKLVVKQWVVANNNSLFDSSSVTLMNALADPTYHVYRTVVTWDEIMLNGMDWSRVDNLSNGGKFRIWEWLFKNSVNAINPSRPSIRAGINTTWVGTAADLAVRAAVYLHCYRPARLVEKLLKTAGNGTAADAVGDGPATMGFEGEITLQDVIDSEAA